MRVRVKDISGVVSIEEVYCVDFYNGARDEPCVRAYCKNGLSYVKREISEDGYKLIQTELLEKGYADLITYGVFACETNDEFSDNCF